MENNLDNSAEALALLEKFEKVGNFNRLFETECPRLVRILIRLTGDQGRAEDLVQETFLQFHRQQRTLDNPAAWLHRVALRLGFNSLRTERRRARWEQTASMSASLPSMPDAELRLAEHQELARRALSRMPRRSAQLLILRYSGMSFAGMSEVMGVRPASVGTLLNRAEQDFKRRYLKLSKGARP